MILKGTKIDEAGNLKSNEAIFCKAIPAVSIKKGTKQIENSRRMTKNKTTYENKKNAM